MASAVKFLEYTILLTDKDLVATQQAAHPQGLYMAPQQAALDFDAFMIVPGNPGNVPPPRIESPWFLGSGSPSSQYPTGVASFTKKSGGWFGLSFLFGTTTTYKWVGKFAFASTTLEEDGSPLTQSNLAKRRFLVSFDSPSSMEMASLGTNMENCHRAASRHVDGMGFYYSGAGNEEITASSTESGDGASATQWDRFYIRIIAAPDVVNRIWRVVVTGGASRGASLNITPDMRIIAHKITDAGAESVIATTSDQLELNTWYRVDVLTEVKTPGGNLRVYLNKELVMTAIATGSGSTGGINNTSTVVSTFLGGGALANTSDTFRCHFDDWCGGDWPTLNAQGKFGGKDWNNGSRVRMITASGAATGNAWTGDYRQLNAGYQNPGQANAAAKMTSVVSGDAQRLTVPSGDIIGADGAVVGVNCFVVCWYGQQTVAGNGTLGWKYNGLIDLAAHVEGTGLGWTRRWQRPAAALDPIASITPFELHKVKAANVNAANCHAFTLVVELLGTFGDEDVPEDTGADPEDTPTATPRPLLGVHNAPYPNAPWSRQRLPTQNPVVIHTGSYTGNDTVQELQFRCPVNWLVITRQPSASTGGFWFSSHAGWHAEGELGSHPAVVALIDPTLVPDGDDDDQEQRTLVRIVGNHAQLNASGVAYQYVAFSDPGARYCQNGVFHANSNGNATVDVPLTGHSNFTPRFSFMQKEAASNAATYLRASKGPGHAANAASIMNIAENATAWQHALGKIIADDLMMTTSANNVSGFSAWRSDDQGTDPNKLNVVAIGSYVGDGAASRTITFGSSGKRPVYAIVQPHSATPAHHRNPFNLTNTSNAMGTGSSTTTGITAGGIDSFTVGSTLNANGVTFEYFVLIGSATAGNGGWSIDGEFAVVEPDSGDADYDPTDSIDDPDEEEPEPDPDPGPDDTDDCADGTVCVEATTRIVNLALLEIGVLKILDNYCTEDSREAVIAREIYEQCVRHTLITYPWPFATKYATLALIAAQPSNEDWTYAYRMPVDCIFPRRIVVTRGTAVDPSPPPMGLSSDDTGQIILANEANAVLEYTARPGCVGFNGDDLFREALKWRLAAALAPPLTRIAGEADRCLKMFEIIVQKAESVVKQGVPGLRAAASTLDTTAAARAANVQVVNRALIRIGARTITNMTSEQSREAVAAALVFEDELRSVLRDFPWAFATRYVDPATLVDGAEGDPVNVDWTFAHRLPTDFVFLRRLALEGVGRSFDPDPYPYRIGSDDVGGLLYSNQEEPLIEYTARLQNIMVHADPVFSDALAWRIAATLAPSLANVELHRPEQHGRGPETPQDPTRRHAMRNNDQNRRVNIAQWAWAMYERALMDAKVVDRNESMPEPHPDAEWIRARD